MFPRISARRGACIARVHFRSDANGRDKDLPVGVSKRNVQGIDRVFLNCAVCHVGTVRDTPESPPRIIVGMPANNVDLQASSGSSSPARPDEKFTPERIVAGDETPWLPGTTCSIALLLALPRHRLGCAAGTLLLRHRFSFMDREPDTGPGRVDTFNPPKVLLNFPHGQLCPTKEWVGNCDLPSIWNQRQRKGMQLHWDGNNTSVEERNRSAAFGTGATPADARSPAMKRTGWWLLDKAKPPPYPYPRIDAGARGRKAQPLYAQYCAALPRPERHRLRRRSWSARSRRSQRSSTDRHRLDSYTHELSRQPESALRGLSGGALQTFPQDLRLRQSAARRHLAARALSAQRLGADAARFARTGVATPAELFIAATTFLIRKRVGFISNVPAENGRKFFRFDTTAPGNGNFGHEVADGSSPLPRATRYGTESARRREGRHRRYLKTF